MTTTPTPLDLAARRAEKDKARTRQRTRGGRPIKKEWATTEPMRNEETGESFTGSGALDDITAFYAHYMALPSTHCAPTMALWAAHTYMTEHVDVTPRLVFQSPEPGSGKTRGLELLEITAFEPRMTMNTSTAALYRRIEGSGDHPITILQDEFDAVWSRNASPGSEDLRALYNSGYRRGATVDRCEGDGAKMMVREFRVYAPVAMAGLSGRLPGTLQTRSILIDMQRRAPGEVVGDFRSRAARAEIAPVVSNLGAWVSRIGPMFDDHRVALPAGVTDRAAELWEALIYIADRAGGHWPDTARAACRHFVLDRRGDDPSIAMRLLDDIRGVFETQGVDHMSTPTLLKDLIQLPESEWAEFFGKPLTVRQLAVRLKPYGVRPHQIWTPGVGKVRGYSLAGEKSAAGDASSGGLKPAFERYLTAPKSPRNQESA